MLAVQALWAIGITVLLVRARIAGRGRARPVVLGAAGGIGSHVVDALLAAGRPVRAVTRTAVPVPEGAERRVADLRDPAALRAAVAGAEVVVHAAQPAHTRWVQEFPSLTAAIADATEGTRLVVADSLYGYGPVDGPLTEDLPGAATDAKGARARRDWPRICCAGTPRAGSRW